jgi:hypothetical protein
VMSSPYRYNEKAPAAEHCSAGLLSLSYL